MELYILPFQENSPNIMYKDFNGGFKYKNNNFKLYINIFKNNIIYNSETSKIDASVQLHGITKCPCLRYINFVETFQQNAHV